MPKLYLDRTFLTTPWLPQAAFAIAVLLIALSCFSPGISINLWLNDALWFANAGYLVSLGFTPHIDFAWPFGGYDAVLIGAAMKLFGISINSLQQAAAFHYGLVCLLLVIGVGRRARWPIFLLLFMLVSAIALTRYPFENGPRPNLDLQSFSMWYNRISWSLSIVLFSVLLLGREPLRKGEWLAAGASLYLMVLSKLTFGLFAPLAFALAYWRDRWRGVRWLAAAATLPALLAWIVLGFGPSGYVRMFADFQQNYADHLAMVTDFGPVFKLAYMLMTQAIETLVLTALIAYFLYCVPPAEDRQRLFAIGVLLVLSFGVGVSNAGLAALEVVIPAIAFVAILLADHGLNNRTRLGWALPISAAASLYAFAFATPYLMNYAAGVAKGMTRADQSLFRAGPLAGLVVDQLNQDTTPSFASEDEAVRYIAKRRSLEPGMAWATDHVWQYVYRDAIRLAEPVRNLRVSAMFAGANSFTLESRPLLPFAFYYGVHRPGALRTLPNELDAVLVPKFRTINGAEDFYRADISENFRLTAQSELWELHNRTRPSK
jgi:hypothetical protein